MRKARAAVTLNSSPAAPRAKDVKPADPVKLVMNPDVAGSEAAPAVNNSTAVVVCQGGSETPIEATGVYADAKYTAMLTSVIGCDVTVLTTGCARFQGVLDSVSPENTFVLRMATRVDPQLPRKIDVDSLKEALIFQCDKVVKATASAVDLEYACRSPAAFQTDAAISEQTGRKAGLCRQLEPWVADEAPAVGSAAQLVSLDSANGWDAQDMFLINERKYGVRSTYDQSMAGYTSQLAPASALLESQAARIASEIEAGSEPRVNGDEEGAFSAVVRADSTSSSSDRYVPPGRRSMAATPLPSSRHQHHHVQHYRGRSRAGPAGQRGAHHRSSHHHSQQQAFHAPPTTKEPRDNHRQRAAPESSPSPSSQQQAARQQSVPATSANSTGKPQQNRAPAPSPGQKAATISELRQFRDNFVLAESSAPAPAKTTSPVSKQPQVNTTGCSDVEESVSSGVSPPPPCPVSASVADPAADRDTAESTVSASTANSPAVNSVDDTTRVSTSAAPTSVAPELPSTASIAAKSKLNPNAKVFTLNPNAKSFTPAASLSGMTPPRATPPAVSMAQYPPLMPVTAATPVPATVGAAGIGYIVTPPIALAHNSQHLHHAHHPHPGAARYPKQRPVSSAGGDFGAGLMMAARGDPTSLHVAAMTGQPLLAGHPGAASAGAAPLALAPAPGLHDFPPGAAAAPVAAGAGGPVIVRIQAPTTMPMAYQHPAASVALTAGPYETCQPPPPLPPQPPPHSSSLIAYNLAAQQAAAAGIYQYPAGAAPSNMYLLPAGQQLQPFFPAPAPQPFIIPPQPPLPPPPSAVTPQQQPPPPTQQSQPQQYPPSYPVHPSSQHQLHAVHHGQP